MLDITLRQRVRVPHRLQLALGVIGGAREPEVDVGDVCLGQAEREVREARGRLEKNWQNAGGQRVERPRVTHAVGPGQVAKASHHGK